MHGYMGCTNTHTIHTPAPKYVNNLNVRPVKVENVTC